MRKRKACFAGTVVFFLLFVGFMLNAAGAGTENTMEKEMAAQSELLPEMESAAELESLAGAELAAAAGIETEDESMSEKLIGIYMGIEGYGTEAASRDHLNELRYRFLIDGGEQVFEMDNGEPDEEGEFLYPLQNEIKEGYEYSLTTDAHGMITKVRELPREKILYIPPVKGVPGEMTLRNFLKLAMEPVGTVLYIYGGGWNWQDDAASVQAKSIGVSADWIRFFREQNAGFTYRDRDGDESKKDAPSSYYPYGGYNEYYYAGLDCSGYAGWVIYQLLNTENGNDGYVTFASGTAKLLADAGLGTLKKVNTVKPGDVVSLGGHVWISLGTCSDGSVVLVHSTPSFSREGQPGGGVQISAAGFSEDCEAYALADAYMSRFFPEWYSRYAACLKDPETYFLFDKDDLGVFSWDTEAEGGIKDPEGIQKMGAEQVLELIFGG